MNRPWHARSIELEPKEGPWCDYAAFREWFSAEENKLVDPGDILALLDDDLGIDPINLYVIFCKVFDEMPDLPEFVTSGRTTT
jgi:hypothetical protein